MRGNKYILVDKDPVECHDLMEWGTWLEDKDSRVVKQEEVGRYLISTVFLGIDHYCGDDIERLPVLFETMVFDGNFSGTDLACERCCTYQDAVEQHEAVKARFIKGSQ